MITYQARAASAEVYGLAEGPLWDADRRRVLWVDINAGVVHTGILLEDDRIEAHDRISIDRTVGAVACSAAGELLVAGVRQLYTIAPDGAVTAGLQLIPDGKNSRFNDGKCDPRGRFLVGTLALDDRVDDEVLYSVGTDGDVSVLDDDLGLSNGLGWSPDGTVLYSVDSNNTVVWSRTYDPDTGSVGARSEFLRLTDGSPDGLCIDAEGNVWLAVWGAGQVRCYSPAGDQLAAVEVGAPNTSSVAFAGPDLDILVITSASEQLSDDQLAAFPDSGRLFTCRVGATGLPVTPWAAR